VTNGTLATVQNCKKSIVNYIPLPDCWEIVITIAFISNWQFILVDHNHRILLQILCKKNCGHILLMHFSSRWHVNKKNDIIISLQVFIHMASMIDDKVTCMSKITFDNVTKIMSFHIWLQNDYANDMDKMNTKYIHKII